MCQAKSEGGKRCTYADQITNVRKKALYKHRNDYSADRKAWEAVNAWKDANKELVAEHLPEKQRFQIPAASDTPIPKELMDQFTPNSRTPIKGGHEGLTKEAFDENEAWAATLTQAEDRAIGFYTMNGYQSINSILRRNTRDLRAEDRTARDPKHWEFLEKNAKEKSIPSLDSALAKAEAVSAPRKLYRFYRIPAGMTTGQFIDKYMEPGGGFKDDGYMSTTSDPGFLMAHVRNRLGSKPNQHYVVFEILTGQGASLQDDEETRPGNVQSLEHEYLIPRRTKFRIAGVRKRQKFVYGRDRRDLWKQYSGAASYGSGDWAWDREKGYHADSGESFPVIQLVDERLIREHSKESSKR